MLLHYVRHGNTVLPLWCAHTVRNRAERSRSPNAAPRRRTRRTWKPSEGRLQRQLCVKMGKTQYVTRISGLVVEYIVAIDVTRV